MAILDRSATRTASLRILAVALTAAVLNFSHVRAVAVRAREGQLTSWMLPVSIDGAVVAAVSVLLADSRAGRRPAALTWLLDDGKAVTLIRELVTTTPKGSASRLQIQTALGCGGFRASRFGSLDRQPVPGRPESVLAGLWDKQHPESGTTSR